MVIPQQGTRQEQIDKAQVLIEALPYMQGFRGQTFLIKVGGSAMEDPALVESLMRDIVFMEVIGINPVIVHGGGKAISRAMSAAGLEARFVGGLRVTDEAAVAIVEKTLSQRINPALVQMLTKFGGRGQGFAGTEVFIGERLPPVVNADGTKADLGCVGSVVDFNITKIEAAIAAEEVPVVSPIAKEAMTGQSLNVNADVAAAALAGKLGADKIIFISDVLGVMRDPADRSSLIATITRAEADQLIEDGVISGGMIPKVRSSQECLNAGVEKVHLIDGRIQHSLLLEIFTEDGIGTEIVP
ncbi:MAG: acetylglutamate kinase [Verrucomicrobiales bacterium]|jgi:acetylglutamate kinase